MNKINTANKIINVLLVILGVAVVINSLVFIFITYIYKIPLNTNTPYRYNNSLKVVENVVTLLPTGIYYDDSFNALYLYNEDHDVMINYFLEGITLNTLRDFILSDIEDVLYTEVDENVYSVVRPYDCDTLSINTLYNEQNTYNLPIIDYVQSLKFCDEVDITL